MRNSAQCRICFVAEKRSGMRRRCSVSFGGSHLLDQSIDERRVRIGGRAHVAYRISHVRGDCLRAAIGCSASALRRAGSTVMEIDALLGTLVARRMSPDAPRAPDARIKHHLTLRAD
ncbi:hypothetical protein [Burkholderia mayonis]|uniref:hypothetical protein n=1 Tax=Burkholderia mayonis TaxID=1385591 RepID=UPI00131F2C43|nr:hypothetical protein [Burkholderia mayonis]